jgi:3-hydroxyisobutyrate dehydrogenase-like beta-hydroxyacid dehydrogenase
MTRIAFLGLGRMGAAMAARLLAAGHDVTVWNRGEEGHYRLAAELAALPRPGSPGPGDGPEPGEAVPGLGPPRRADDPASAVAGADVVLTMLADGPALESVLFGAAGAAAALREGTIVCDLSTIGPGSAVWCHDRLASRGVDFLDAPVSGSVPTVRAGGLLVMAGGSPEALARVTPALQAFSAAIVHVGASGSGQAMKLAVNACVHGLNAVLGEALVLAERGGVDRRIALDVFGGSVVGAPFVLYKRPSLEDPEGEPVSFTVDLMRKDLDLIEQLAQRVGAPVPMTRAAHAVADAASAAGLGPADMSAVAVHHRASIRQG